MPAASEYADLTAPGARGLYRWEVYDAASKVDLCASAVGVEGKLFFVDPIPLEQPALGLLLARHVPAGIVVTNGNHARAAAEFRRRFKVPLALTEEAQMEAGLEGDHVIPAEGGLVFGGVFEAVPLPGGAAGEVALHHSGGGGLLVVGDAVINLASFPLGLLPVKYCADAGELRRSVFRLLDFSFSTMLFAHGEPLMTRARERLVAMLSGEASR